MAALRVRRYEPGDADRVWELHETALRDAGAFDEAFAHLDSDLRAVEAEYIDGGGEFLVGTIDGDIVAMGAYRPVDGDTVELKRMRVDPDHQRNGYGQRLLDELEARAAARGYESVVLDTTERQTAARAFYEANGYEQFDAEELPAIDTTQLYYRKSIE